jgi:hypothetical protein
MSSDGARDGGGGAGAGAAAAAALAAEQQTVVFENIAQRVIEETAKAEAVGDDSGSAMSVGEKKLLLRHRDSFMVTKTHMTHEHGGSGRSAGSAGPGGGSRATVAGLYSASGLGEPQAAAGRQGGEEGGREDSEDVLEGLDLGGGGGGGAGGGPSLPYGSPAGGGGALQLGSPSSGASGSGGEDSPRKKNRLFSIVKGVASALGLRASKKKRNASAAAAAAGASPGSGGGASPGGAASPGFSAAGSPRAGSFAAGADFDEYEPQTDDTGSYVPTHRTRPTPRSILKTNADGSPRAPPQDAGGGEDAASARSGARGGFAGDESGGRRGLSFADQHGHDLELVRFSERLHYSGTSEHVNWEENGRSCSVM